jgi:hypothetical protein
MTTVNDTKPLSVRFVAKAMNQVARKRIAGLNLAKWAWESAAKTPMRTGGVMLEGWRT